MENSNFWKVSEDEILWCRKVGEKAGNNLYIFENEGNFGVVDKILNIIIPLEYECVSLAFDEHFWARKEGKWKLINLKNQTVFERHFAEISHFTMNFCCVSEDGEHYGFIDRTGKTIIEFKHLKGKYLGGMLFAFPKIVVKSHSKITSLNINGEILKYGVLDYFGKIVHPFTLDKYPTLKEVHQYLHTKRKPLE